MDRWKILDKVSVERDRQDEKWGVQGHAPMKWMTILMEEVGETSKAILEDKVLDYEKELIQVAAVAVAALEDLNRQDGIHPVSL